jgi:hypothetical protein
MRRTIRFMLVGAIVGVLVASVVVPPLLIWYNEPGAVTPGRETEMICNVPTLIRYATRRLLLGQVIGGVMGAMFFLVISSVARGREDRAAPA